jgi:hypothetical protein
MLVNTILNRVQKFKSFVVEGREAPALVHARANSGPMCSGWEQCAP